MFEPVRGKTKSQLSKIKKADLINSLLAYDAATTVLENKIDELNSKITRLMASNPETPGDEMPVIAGEKTATYNVAVTRFRIAVKPFTGTRQELNDHLQKIANYLEKNGYRRNGKPVMRKDNSGFDCAVIALPK